MSVSEFPLPDVGEGLTEAEIVENIAGLRGQYTVVAITHRPAWGAIADRQYLVQDGQVVKTA